MSEFWYHVRMAWRELRYVRPRWPWISRKQHAKILLAQTDDLVGRMTREREEFEAKFREIKDLIYDLRVDAVRSYNSVQFVVRVAFQEKLVGHERMSDLGPWLAARCQAEIVRGLAQLDFSKLRPWPPENQPRKPGSMGFQVDPAK